MEYTPHLNLFFSSVFLLHHKFIFQFRIFTAPFHHVGFADFWLADQLNSLAVVLLDFEYMICYYAMEVEWWGGDSKLISCST